MKNYSLEELVKIFTDHTLESQEQKKKDLASFKENYPDAELPEHFKDDFSLSLALRSLCEEVLKIKCAKKREREIPRN